MLAFAFATWLGVFCIGLEIVMWQTIALKRRLTWLIPVSDISGGNRSSKSRLMDTLTCCTP